MRVIVTVRVVQFAVYINLIVASEFRPNHDRGVLAEVRIGPDPIRNPTHVFVSFLHYAQVFVVPGFGACIATPAMTRVVTSLVED